MNRRLLGEIRGALILGVRRNLDRIFDLSQKYVPVRTGTLKKSGTRGDTKDGGFLAYRTSYAADVERGRKGQPYEGSQTVQVRGHSRGPYLRREYYSPAHSRLVPSTIVSRHLVGPHSRTYVGKRLVRFDGNPPTYRVLGKTAGFKGRFYVTNAVKDGIKSLVEDIGFHLKRLESKVL